MVLNQGRGRRTLSYLTAAALIAQTTGCSTMKGFAGDKFRAYTANVPEIDHLEVEEFTESQLRIWASFLHLATASNVSPTEFSEGNKLRLRNYYTSGSPSGLYNISTAENLLENIEGGPKKNFKPVVNAGIVYVNERCNEYLSALNFFARTRDATSRQINAVGTAAGAALAVVEASKQLIGLTPLGFKLLDDTVLNVGKGLLFELPPTTIKKLVQEKQSAFVIANAKVQYDNRIDALRAIQSYVDICLPTSIEAEVEAAVARAEFKRSEEQTKDELPKQNGAPAAAVAGGAAPAAVTTPTKNEPPIIVPKE